MRFVISPHPTGPQFITYSLGNLDSIIEMEESAIHGKKRREPEYVPPVETGGIRYEAPFECSLYGYQQDGGIIVARDAASGTLEWTQKIYSIAHDGDMEDDKQDIFIQSMVPTKNGKCLLITNEHGSRFELDLSTRVSKTHHK